MSFHKSAQKIQIHSKDGSTVLSAVLVNDKGESSQQEIRLDDHLGVMDGWFSWDGENFTGSADNLTFEMTEDGACLRANLRKRDGSHREDQTVCLSDRLSNDNGKFKYNVCILP
ncbi:unnamed protein product [Penicillium bialowiezense]